MNRKRTNAKSKKIVVTGDPTIDWLEVSTPPVESESGEATPVYNWQSYRGDALHHPAGRGAAKQTESGNEASEEVWQAFKYAKGPDFVSRLRGYVNIKGANPISAADTFYLIRRVLQIREARSGKDHPEVAVSSNYMALLPRAQGKYGKAGPILRWDGRNDAGQEVAAGNYLYRLVSGEFIQTRRMVLVK